MAIREGKWRCSKCSSINLGRNMACTACGAVRDEGVEFFLEDDAPELSDQALKDLAAAGPDWHCRYCTTDNRAVDQFCGQCGAGKDGSKPRDVRFVPQGDGTTDPASPGDPTGVTTTAAGSAPSARPGTSPARPRTKVPVLIWILGGIAVLGALMFFLLNLGTETELIALDASWTRAIAVERQEWVTHETWDDQVAIGARILSQWEEQRGTEKVQTGTERVKTGTRDLGNGFFEDVYEDRAVYREDPVYDTRVSWEAREWVVYRTETARGTLSDPPRWPDTGLAAGDREGRRTEEAVLRFRSTDKDFEGRVFTWTGLSPDELTTWKAGQTVRGVVFGDSVLRLVDEDE